MSNAQDPDGHPTTWHNLTADGLSVRYYSMGSSEGDVWLVFHGFGQTVDDWLAFAPTLAQLGRVIWIELPAHGQTSVPPDNQAISLLTWEHWLQAFCRKERIHTCSLLGYSLGGRLALASLQVLKGRVEQVVLCAAEGGSRSFWYGLATATWVGRSLLQNMVDNPGWLVGSVKLLGNLRIINKSVARFAALQLNTRPKRRLVARSWLALRAIPESPSDLADILNAFNIPLHIIAGHHDRVVPLHRMTRLSDAVSHAQITILKTGHNQLPKATIEMLVAEQNTHV